MVRHSARVFVVGLLGVLVACVAGCGGSSGGAAPSAPPTSTFTIPPTGGAGTTGPGPGRTSTPAAGAPTFPYQPLWPFSTTAQAVSWRDQSAGGSDPWHADPVQTASRFAKTFLGFADVTQVIAQTVKGDEARVTVGIRTETSQPSSAAVVHLVRYGGGGTSAPWEVVGTDDTTLSLTTPGYGATVGPTITVGGVISGVDESIHVQARLVGGTVVGDSCCQSAGGQRAPWRASVTIRGVPAGQRVILVVSTGGHVAAVERFAVTGVTVRG
jgi:hypothetical protein